VELRFLARWNSMPVTESSLSAKNTTIRESPLFVIESKRRTAVFAYTYSSLIVSFQSNFSDRKNPKFAINLILLSHIPQPKCLVTPPSPGGLSRFSVKMLVLLVIDQN